jgi:hypothetical protein
MLHNQRAIFLFAIVFAMIFAFSENAQTGQFKRIRDIPNGGEVQVHSSPKNFGRDMEMDIYEFESATEPDQFRCRIVSNSTGQELAIFMYGSDGSLIQSCITTLNGTCTTASQTVGANVLLQCRVSAVGLATSTAHYIMSVRRP